MEWFNDGVREWWSDAGMDGVMVRVIDRWRIGRLVELNEVTDGWSIMDRWRDWRMDDCNNKSSGRWMDKWIDNRLFSSPPHCVPHSVPQCSSHSLLLIPYQIMWLMKWMMCEALWDVCRMNSQQCVYILPQLCTHLLHTLYGSHSSVHEAYTRAVNFPPFSSGTSWTWSKLHCF